jgi:hypothetical protein
MNMTVIEWYLGEKVGSLSLDDMFEADEDAFDFVLVVEVEGDDDPFSIDVSHDEQLEKNDALCLL